MTLAQALTVLKAAQHPEDVFPVNGNVAEDIKARFRVLAKLTHSDQYTAPAAKALADEAFKLLNEWNERAQAKLADGTFGDRGAIKVALKTRSTEYVLTRRMAPGDLCNVYAGTVTGKTDPLLFKVVQEPANNDLALNERDILTYLRTDAAFPDLDALHWHVPKLVDSFELTQGKDRQRVNVLERFDASYVSLQAIIEAFPNGIDPRDAAWMFRRLLGALICLHVNGVVHGAVIPSHVFVCLKDKTEAGAHNGVLIDYSYAVKTGKPIKAIVPAYHRYYPSDVLDKLPADSGVDLHMAGELLEDLVGGFRKLPAPMAAIVRACQLGYKRRLKDPDEVYEEFSKVIKFLYGPPRFRKFELP